MTKWVALALGALLALVGAVCIGLGYDVIQTERGGVLVIAGAVALTGGVLTFALFAVLGELQALLAMRSKQPMEAPAISEPSATAQRLEPAVEEAVAPSPVVPPAPAKALEAAPAAPVFHEPAASEPSAPVASAKPASTEPKVWERPYPYRSPPFVPSRSATPAAVVAGAATVAVVAAVTRQKDEEPVSESPVHEPVAVEVEDHVERAIEHALTHEPPGESEEVAKTAESADDHPSASPRQPSGLRAALGLQQLPPEETPPADEMPAKEEPKPAPEPLIDVEASPSVAAGYAWLERALATEDGRKSRALEWLRARQRSGAVDDSSKATSLDLLRKPESAPEPEPTSPPAADVVAERVSSTMTETPATTETAPETAAEPQPAPGPELVAGPEAFPDSASQVEVEVVFAADIEPEPEPEQEVEAQDDRAELEEKAQEAAPEPHPTPDSELQPEPEPEQPTEPAPTIIGRYSSGGSDFTLYSDGSIDAQTDEGIFHFASMADLRAHIEAQNAQG